MLRGSGGDVHIFGGRKLVGREWYCMVEHTKVAVKKRALTRTLGFGPPTHDSRPAQSERCDVITSVATLAAVLLAQTVGGSMVTNRALLARFLTS